MDHLQLEAHCLEARGLQQIECGMARSKVEGLYGLLQGAVTQLELSVSVGLPLPKRHKWLATAMVTGPKAQESEAIIPKPKGGVSMKGLFCVHPSI